MKNNNNILRGILVCLITYVVGRLIGGLWVYCCPEKATKFYKAFTRWIRVIINNTFKFVRFERAYDSEIPVTQNPISDYDDYCEIDDERPVFHSVEEYREWKEEETTN